MALRIGIIGAGPIGLTLYRFLEKFGHNPQIFDHRKEHSNLPKAHYIQNRSLEIFKELDLAEEIYAAWMPHETWKRFVYCQHLDGKIYRTHNHFEGARWERVQQMTAMSSANLAQNKLVHILHHDAVQFGMNFKRLKQDDSCVEVEFANGHKEQFDYLVGCDGAHSSVRSELGIKQIGEKELFRLINIWFKSKHLAQNLHPAMLSLIFNRDIAGVLIHHYDDLFVMQIPYYENLQKEWDPLTLIGMLFEGKTPPKDIEIINDGKWTMANQFAETFQNNRVFLAGDACHTTPPSGAFGMNLGVQDVHNLAWKFSFPELLPTYGTERIPHVYKVQKQSFENYRTTKGISDVFGVSPSAGNLLDQMAGASGPFGGLFSSLAQLRSVVFDDSKAVEYLANDKNLLHLLFPREDLGIFYREGFKGGNGGGLVPSFTVNGVNSRLIASTAQSPQMVYLQGKNALDFECRYDYSTVKTDQEWSYLLRPDSHIYETNDSAVKPN